MKHQLTLVQNRPTLVHSKWGAEKFWVDNYDLYIDDRIVWSFQHSINTPIHAKAVSNICLYKHSLGGVPLVRMRLKDK